MKKLLTVLAVFSLILAVSPVQAAGGGLEVSGHIETGTGWQRYKVDAAGGLPVNRAGTQVGVLGAGQADAGVDAEDDFGFFVKEIELDLAKTFGENIRFRADIDFGTAALGSDNGLPGVAVEQAYATANIPVGNGIEFLVGRFNAPVGFEPVDTVDMNLISHTQYWNSGAVPHNLTGAKVYYPFTDMVDLHVFVVNDYNDDAINSVAATADSDYPSFGLRLGVNWGDEDQPSTVGLSGLVGPENAEGVGSEKVSFLGDLDFNWWATEAFAVGGEFLYRHDAKVAGTATNGKFYAGMLNLHYNFSDVWDGTLRYDFTNDVNAGGTSTAGSFTGANQQIHQVALGGGYSIADGARVKLEGNYTYLAVDTSDNNQVYGLAGVFSYAF